MSRRSRSRVRFAGLVGLVMVAATACSIPIGTITSLPIPCSIYVGEPAHGVIAIDIIPGTLGVGCL